jgi:hypothetical protein
MKKPETTKPKNPKPETKPKSVEVLKAKDYLTPKNKFV